MLDPLEKCSVKGDISKTLVRFQKLYPKTFSQEQIKQVESQVGEGGIQVLAYHLSLQMMKTQMQKVGNDSEQKWQYEQKMWHLATFDQDGQFNQAVRMDLVRKMKSFNQPYQGVTFFTLGDYVASLHASFQKVCPWVTIEQIENAVHHFILDLLHKCEAILLDQLELKLIEAQLESRSIQSEKLAILKDSSLYNKILNRFKRIFGS